MTAPVTSARSCPQQLASALRQSRAHSARQHAIDLQPATPADAVAPYHPTAVGVYSRLPRQPQPASNRDINTAYVYAVYTYFQSALPQFDSRWRRMMNALDLDPDDTSLCASGASVCSPIEIGNTAARIAIAARANDGMNRDGNITRKYNPMPFEDYTGYEPVNTAYTLADASRWQPANQRQRYGVYKIQQVPPLQPCHPRLQLAHAWRR